MCVLRRFLSKRERERLNTGVKKLDLKRLVLHTPFLPYQLIKTGVADLATDLRLQPFCQFTDFCFRLFPLGHLDFQVFYMFQRLIR